MNSIAEDTVTGECFERLPVLLRVLSVIAVLAQAHSAMDARAMHLKLQEAVKYATTINTLYASGESHCVLYFAGHGGLRLASGQKWPPTS